jgi:hypothetical protein
MTTDSDDAPDGKTGPSPAAAPAPADPGPAIAARSGPELRRALLARLRPLGVRTAGPDQWFGLDGEEELKSVLEQDADALLEPLESLARDGRG